LCAYCVNMPKEGGFTPDEMGKALRVLEVIEKGGDELQFEDADFAYLQQRVAESKWGVVNKEIAEFAKVVKDM